MSCEVLQLMDQGQDDILNGIVLLQKVPYYNMDCLQLAVEAGCLRFISLGSVQNLITDIWNGKIEPKNGLKASLKFALSCLSFGLLSPFLLFNSKTRLTKANYKTVLNKLPISHNKKLKAA
jgi:hypothetical protein